ncbi:MAG: Uma2 family endonuclease [Deltaproteobacteria bacterium]|nr:Uma2 family endonuclease [Deltaproteobacteria bacterium]
MPQLSGTVEFGTAVKLNVQRTRLTKEQFALLCQENRERRFELTAQQELVIMAPAGSETGLRNSRLAVRFGTWAEADGTGLAFDSSAGFTLPNGAIRSPDASWIRQERWNALTKAQRMGFAPICPDFVVELRSPTDRLADLQDKMQEYIDNGAHIGWLIDPTDKRVYVYRPAQPIEVLDNPATLNGAPTLPGFVLPVRELW